MISVSVPATSANIGPGFDCMGMALQLYATVYFERIHQGVEISGCSPQWQNEHNLVYQAFCNVCKSIHREIMPVRIVMDAAAIPEARGLGSSAVCIVAGAFGANALLGYPLNQEQLLQICSEMEGHPDNVAPAIYGGLTISLCEGNKIYTARYAVDKAYRFLAMIPDYPVKTKDARAVLPDVLPLSDAVFNIGRCAALAKGLSEGDRELIKHGCADRLHQPYRKVLLPQYDQIDQLCKKYGVLAWYISGSGSTMMAITDQDRIADAFLQAVQSRYPTWQVKKLYADQQGVLVKEEPHG